MTYLPIPPCSPGASPERLIIATRKSRLALWQAEHVQSALVALYPQCRVELLPMSTRGDEMLEATLAAEGGKGLFIKELERALADARADIAVHSMKDLPVELPAEFVLAAITERQDPRDAFVSNQHAGLAQLPAGAIVGTSSLRRAAQISERFPALTIRALRGNVDTRLAKLDTGEYAAIVLAAAGLQRLGLESRIRNYLAIEHSLPSPGQGALGIECRADRPGVIAALQPLAHVASSACVRAERAVNRALGGNCSIPLGAYAQISGDTLVLRGLVAAPDGKRIARAQETGSADAPEALGARVAARLRERGATEILSALAESMRV
ncbi:MAG: hydroxymethylbilane synthase [Betaproteobacteria bacterium]|nr:hydroxymethylbilane synthase [Betaproteobacteria bacterium]